MRFFFVLNTVKEISSLEHLEELWNNVLAQVEQKISKPSFETWLKSTKLLSYNGSGSTVTIAAPNSFARDWLENHYIHLITGILTELTGEDLLIKFVVQKTRIRTILICQRRLSKQKIMNIMIFHQVC